MYRIKKNQSIIILMALICMSYTSAHLMKDPNSPVNYTGAPRATSPIGQVRYCSNSGCHSDFALDIAGGGVVATGLPAGTYAAGQTYTFSIKINHATPDKTNWGFAIKAVNAVDNDVAGTFSTTSSYASVKGSVAAKTSELSHSNAPSTAASDNYTFMNLQWTAPASPTANETNIKFYIVGLAGDADGSEAGDYVYSAVVSVSAGVLPVILNSFTSKIIENNAVTIDWQTSQEINSAYFDLETSTNSMDWSRISRISAAVNSTEISSYSFTDDNPSSSNGTVYYRLKMVDQDGNTRYSAITTARLQATNLVIESLSPQQLINGNVIFKVSGKPNYSLMITAADMSGRLLYKNNLKITTSTKTIEIPAAALSKARGMILITFKAPGFEKTFKQLNR